ncbi:MAG: NUDIX hydrolase [Bacteroidales bacterium]|nr:NUDIX hydrolase [Bacteroidales bacterium]
MKVKIEKFNIRVYGIAINEKMEVLLTDEFRLGMYMTKFPGGGLEFGEGTLDCLRRECREELGREIVIKSHYYTTDYFQPTFLLNEPQQLLSIYYLIKIANEESIQVSRTKFDFEAKDGAQIFRWEKLANLHPDALTFPIDKKVLEMLQSEI